jgi:hypothetical protein
MKKLSLFLLLPFILTACIRGIDNRPDDHATIEAKAPVINLPAPQTVNTDKLEKGLSEIVSSSNATKAELTGLLNAQVSKLGEKVTGLETNLSDLIKINNTMSATAQAEFRARLDATLQAYTEIKAEMHNVLTVNNDLRAQLRVDFGKISADLGAQVGVGNSIDKRIEELKQTFISSAGRDVNMLPQQAVDIIVSSYQTFGITVLLLLSVATIVISMTFKYSRLRAERRALDEQGERKLYYDLLISVTGKLPPEESGEIERQLRNAKGNSADSSV